MEQITCYEDISESIEKWRNVLQLNHYNIKVTADPPECENALAEIELIFGRNIALLYFSKRFFEEDYETQDRAILHELIHIITGPISATGKNMITHCSHDTQHLFKFAVEKEMEYATDKIQEVVYDLYEKCKELKEMACKKGGKKK